MTRQFSGNLFFVKKNRSRIQENGHAIYPGRKHHHSTYTKQKQAKPKPCCPVSIVFINAESISCTLEGEKVLITCSCRSSLIRWGFNRSAGQVYSSSGLPLKNVRNRMIFIKAFDGEECVAFASIDLKKLN